MPIFDEDILAHVLANFKLNELVPDIEEKKKIIQKWVQAINNGSVPKLNETQIQSDFLNQIFGDVLLYSYDYSNEDINMLKEEKVKNTPRKPDASLGYINLSNEKKDVRIVIELKEFESSLDDIQKGREAKIRPFEQGLMYAHENGPKCKWVIISNFDEIRLYTNDDSNLYQLFHITNLLESKEKLNLFFLFLHKDMLISEFNDSPIDKLLQEQRNKNRLIKKPQTKRIDSKPYFYNTIKKGKKDLSDMHIIDQLHTQLSKFKGLNFINPELLSNISPFNTINERVFHYNSSCAAIQSVNEEVYDVFSSIKIENNQLSLSKEFECENAKEKIEDVVKILNSSLIYKVQGYENLQDVEEYISKKKLFPPSLKYELGNYANQLKTFNIKLSDEDNENIISLHLDLKFDKILTKIKVSEGNLEYNSFEIAYATCLLGLDNYKKTYLILKQILEKNKNKLTNEDKINTFLAQYNLKYIFNLISRNYWLDDRDSILNELRNIDLDKVISELDFHDEDIRKALIEIKEDKLFNYSESKVNENYNEIKKIYKLYERGGGQFGSSYANLQWNELILTYNNFTSNYLIFEVYSNFTKYYQTIFNSFIVSYMTDKKYRERFKEFNYYQIILGFLYLSPDTTRKILKEYNVEELNVNNENKEKIIKTILNFLHCTFEHDRNTVFGNIPEKQEFTNYINSNFFIKENYYKVFKNIFLLLSKIPLSREEAEVILESLIKFIKIDTNLHRDEYSYLALWINSLLNTIIEKELTTLLEVILEAINRNNLKNLNSSIIINIVENLLMYKPDYIFPNLSLINKIVYSSYIDKNITNQNIKILVSLWSISDSNNKLDIEKKFHESLSDSFNEYVYKELVTKKIITFDYSDYFEKYTDLFKNYTKPLTEKRAKRTYLQDYSFVHFIQFIYSQNINLNDERLKKINKVEDYYYWLLNFDNFDYKKFNPEWLFYLRSNDALSKFSKIKEVKLALKQYLKTSFYKELAEIYFKYF